MVDKNFTDQNFEDEVIKNGQPVLVDFWAPWCAPCRTVSPIIEELAKEYKGKLKVGKVNVDENPNTASRFGIMSIPSILFFKNGEPIKTMIGAQSKENFRKGINEALGN